MEMATTINQREKISTGAVAPTYVMTYSTLESNSSLVSITIANKACWFPLILYWSRSETISRRGLGTTSKRHTLPKHVYYSIQKFGIWMKNKLNCPLQFISLNKNLKLNSLVQIDIFPDISFSYTYILCTVTSYFSKFDEHPSPLLLLDNT